MRKVKRIIKVGDKLYYDNFTKLFIYELHSAKEFGIATWIISKTKDGHQLKNDLLIVNGKTQFVKGDFPGASFADCKKYLYETFKD